MRKNFIIGLLINLILFNGWAIIHFELPFYKLDLAIAAISIILMSIIHNRFAFLYLITSTLGYGAFITVFAFVSNVSAKSQLDYIYEHLLVTSFLLLFWILIHYLKKISYENTSLKKQLALLEKYDKRTNILTPYEFIYQAKWIIKSAIRNGQAWLVKIEMTDNRKHTKKNLQEYLETIVLSSVREQFDIVTAVPKKIFFILKDTDETGVKIVLNRVQDKLKTELNTISPPYEVKIEHIKDETTLAVVEEELQ
ncbi:hypothetical protein [Fredinandcohnia quinoae]|uniref:Diguanylate cyclase n=1 Tax=Fredinandcohnia quinoae TaxID=2918902 RepID=A0AAW5DVD7_9BACI|nr:hypothetical protein [Fredinandcohnia sp. SECRCQ15]MCH1624601.1 hypothetical protein [Fredinandcohnia sp. SECRCQ15]